MNDLLTTVAAFVLSSSAGLRAYLPLFAVGIAAETGTIHLEPKYAGALTNPLVLAGLGGLSLLELLADKIPALDHLSDVIHTVIRPVMGAIIFSGTQNVVSDHSGIAAAILGGVLAGGVHGAKALSRPVVTATTVGIGNPIVSIVEDVVVITLVVLAFLAPVVAAVLVGLVALLFFLVFRALWRRLRRKKRQSNQPVTVPGGAYADGGQDERRPRKKKDAPR